MEYILYWWRVLLVSVLVSVSSVSLSCSSEITYLFEGTDAVQIANTIFLVEVANTSEERRIGLSNHDGLPRYSGMLFAYDSPGEKTFWMKGMDFPIDIIWIDETCHIVNITMNVPVPKAGLINDRDYLTYSSGVSVQYVLEVNAGVTDRNSIGLTDTVEFISGLYDRYSC